MPIALKMGIPGRHPELHLAKQIEYHNKQVQGPTTNSPNNKASSKMQYLSGNKNWRDPCR